MADFFDRHRALFDWYVPQGSCVAFPRYLGTDGVEEFCRALVEEASVILLPASLFQSRLLPVPSDRFRIGYGRLDFAEGLTVLEEHLRRRSPEPVRRPAAESYAS
jgi:aspartate/methionine/tyrosine aminotransferase